MEEMEEIEEIETELKLILVNLHCSNCNSEITKISEFYYKCLECNSELRTTVEYPYLKVKNFKIDSDQIIKLSSIN